MEVHHCSKKHACLPLPKSRAGSSRRMDVTLLLTILLAQGLLLSLLEEAEASACESAKQFNRCRGEKGDEVLETGCAFTGQQEFPYGYQEHFPTPQNDSQCNEFHTFHFELSDVWSPPQGMIEFDSLRRARLWICVYPPANINASAELKTVFPTSAEGDFQPLETRIVRSPGISKRLLNSFGRCRVEGREHSQSSSTGGCVWKRQNVTSAVRHAIRSGSTRITIVSNLQVRDEHLLGSNGCFRFKREDDSEIPSAHNALLELRYRRWFEPPQRYANTEPPTLAGGQSHWHGLNNCSLTKVPIKLAYGTVQRENGHEFDVNGNDIDYYICQGRCNESHPSLATYINGVDHICNQCRVARAVVNRYVVERSFPTGTVRFSLSQASATSCSCSSNICPFY